MATVLFAFAVAAALASVNCHPGPRTLKASSSVPFIINGWPAAKGRWPWQLALERTNAAGWYHTCGASLIGKHYALTAAHCTVGVSPSSFRVVLGASNRDAHDEEDIINIVDTLIHPAFAPSYPGTPNDISILTLASDAHLNEYVAVGEMASETDDFAGIDCFISGWGKLNGADADVSRQLMEVEMPCITNRDCDDAMWNVIGVDIGPWHICVFDPDRLSSSCQGDSGGPMHCRHSDSEPWRVAGVTSWGVEGCPGTHPSVYTRVGYFRDWIDENTPQRS